MKSVSIPSGADLTAIYREMVGNYPKFFKMDTLCKLGFLLTEMLLSDEKDRFVPRKDRAVLVFSSAGCYSNDMNYAATMLEYPSPSLFVYTLPNIVTGEIAIRNKYMGETSAFLLASFNKEVIDESVALAFQDRETKDAIVAWIDCPSDKSWTAKAWMVNS